MNRRSFIKGFAFSTSGLLLVPGAFAAVRRGRGNVVVKKQIQSAQTESILWSLETSDNNGTLGSASTNMSISSSFSVDVSRSVTKAEVLLYRTGSAANTVSASIYNDSSTKPGTKLADASNTKTQSELTTNTAGEWVTFNFSAFTVASGMNHIVLTYSAEDASNFVRWRFTLNTVTGQYIARKGASFTALYNNSQFAFRVYGY